MLDFIHLNAGPMKMETTRRGLHKPGIIFPVWLSFSGDFTFY